MGFAWLFVPMIGGVMVGALISGRVAGRLTPRRTVGLGFRFLFAGAALNLAVALFVPPGVPWHVLPIFVYALGSAVVMPSITLLLLDLFPANRGLAASLQGFLQFSLSGVNAGTIAPWLSDSLDHARRRHAGLHRAVVAAVDRLPPPHPPHPMTKFLLAVVVGLATAIAAVPAGAQPGKPNTGLPVIKLTIEGHAIDAEVAATAERRYTGLMHRFSMPTDHGMLFVYAVPHPQSYWMRNTYIPLSIAFIDVAGRIINIEDMSPQDERSKWSAGPALYALEMKKGWFAQKGIRPGAKVEGLPGPSRE